jgi:hypothetical protein
MLEKIVSGGQTGADRAALDFAIKHKIPHGGWVPKGRLAEDGPLPTNYNLMEMPTNSYQKRTEQNVINSDGTLIVSHGRLAGGSAYTRTMANRNSQPCLHIDLYKTHIFPASLQIINFLKEEQIKVLNVAGPRASKDPKIYREVKEILAVWLKCELNMDKLISSLQPKKPAPKDIKRPEAVDEAVDRLISEMKLKDLTKLAAMAEDDLVDLHLTVGIWIRHNFAGPGNDKLLQSCREISKEKYLHWAHLHVVVIRELWKRLQKTHRLKVVK